MRLKSFVIVLGPIVLFFTFLCNIDMGSSKKSCSKGILESCGLPGAKRIFAMEYQDKGPSLCKFSRYLVVIKIMDIRHKICHIYYKNADFESIFSQKDSLYCCYMCAKFSSTCKIIFIFSCILSSVLWDNFLWMTLYEPGQRWSLNSRHLF